MVFDFAYTTWQSVSLVAFYTGSIFCLRVSIFKCMLCFTNIFDPFQGKSYWLLCTIVTSLSGFQTILPDCMVIILSWLSFDEGLVIVYLLDSCLTPVKTALFNIYFCVLCFTVCTWVVNACVIFCHSICPLTTYGWIEYVFPYVLFVVSVYVITYLVLSIAFDNWSLKYCSAVIGVYFTLMIAIYHG